MNTLITLTAEQVDAFYEQGYVHVPQLFTPSEMDAMDDGFERLHAIAEEVGSRPRDGVNVAHGGAKFTYSPNGFIRHIAMCGNVEPTLFKFGRDPRLLRIAADLLGSQAMDQLIHQAHFKRPGSGVTFDWHQDCRHRGLGRGGFEDVNGKGSYVQIALAIDDATADNGPLQFIPGTNKLGDLGDDLPNRIDPTQAVAPMIKRGDVVAFGPYTVHGSQANMSDRSRRVFINGFAYPGANRKDYVLPHSGERLTIA